MRAFLLALATSMIWGVVPIIEKTALKNTSPLIGLFLRSTGVIFGAAVFFAIFRPFQEFSQVNLRTYLLFFVAGLLASFLGQITLYHALKIGEASKVIPIAASFPLVTFLLSVIFLGEAFTLSKAFGVLLIVFGIYFIKG